MHDAALARSCLCLPNVTTPRQATFHAQDTAHQLRDPPQQSKLVGTRQTPSNVQVEHLGSRMRNKYRPSRRRSGTSALQGSETPYSTGHHALTLREAPAAVLRGMGLQDAEAHEGAGAHCPVVGAAHAVPDAWQGPQGTHSSQSAPAALTRCKSSGTACPVCGVEYRIHDSRAPEVVTSSCFGM